MIYNKVGMNRIIIVEDEALVALGMRKILESNGYAVIGYATKYTTAYELIVSNSCDLILCDINLGGEYSGIKLMRETVMNSSVPFMFITAYADTDTLKNALETKPANYIIKPFNEEQLLVAVKVALNNATLHKTHFDIPTDTELQVLQLLGKGLSSKDIGRKLVKSQHTIDTHRRNLIKKYKVSNISELICLATARGWVRYE